MPAPLVAAGTRVVAGSVTRGTKTQPSRRRDATIARNRALRETRSTEAEPQTAPQRPSAARQLRQLPKKIKKTIKRVSKMARAAMVHAELALPLVALYVIQLVGWLFFMLMNSAIESFVLQTVDTVIVDMDWIWMAGWALGTMAGLISVGLLMAAYSVALINWFKLWSVIALALTVSLYFAPMLLFFPWILIWMTVVFWTR